MHLHHLYLCCLRVSYIVYMFCFKQNEHVLPNPSPIWKWVGGGWWVMGNGLVNGGTGYEPKYEPKYVTY